MITSKNNIWGKKLAKWDHYLLQIEVLNTLKTFAR